MHQDDLVSKIRSQIMKACYYPFYVNRFREAGIDPLTSTAWKILKNSICHTEDLPKPSTTARRMADFFIRTPFGSPIRLLRDRSSAGVPHPRGLGPLLSRVCRSLEGRRDHRIGYHSKRQPVQSRGGGQPDPVYGGGDGRQVIGIGAGK